MLSDEEFRTANRAFELFTLAERKEALEVFASLAYPSIVDRFHEAVYRVIVRKDREDTHA